MKIKTERPGELHRRPNPMLSSRSKCVCLSYVKYIRMLAKLSQR